MYSGKSQGSDGYPVEFYKRFSDQLAPLLLEMFNYSYSHGSLPATLMQASISLIHKKDKDPLNCASYRPIYLLPVDVKMLAKILAHRMGPIMPSIILEDQTGFIGGRHSFSNIRRFLAVIHTLSSLTDPEVVVLLDTEKAFDRVKRPTSSPPCSDLGLAIVLFPGSNYCTPLLRRQFARIHSTPIFSPSSMAHAKGTPFLLCCSGLLLSHCP